MSGSIGLRASRQRPSPIPAEAPGAPPLSTLNAVIGRCLGLLLLCPDLVRLGSGAPQTRPQTPQTRPQTPHTRRATWIAVVASGLAALCSVVYSAPGMPWHDDVSSVAALQARWTAGGPEAGTAAGGHAQMAAPSHNGDAKSFSAFIKAAGHTAVLDLSPAKVGVNTVAVTVLGVDGEPVEPARWSTEATLDGAEAPAIVVALRSFAPGVAAADSLLPIAGTWTVKITLDLPGIGPTVFTQAVPITE